MKGSEASLEIALSRMAIEEVGANPLKLASEIHRQLKLHTGRVPVCAIARALDVIEIRAETLKSFEGAVLMTPARSRASILVNARSGPRRRRFTIAHELCHFLNTKHKPREEAGFWCDARDIYRGPVSKMMTAYQRQEVEANKFAAALLMPRAQLTPYLRPIPGIEHVLSISELFDVSKQAAAHRYAELHDERIAIVLSQNGAVRYWIKPKGFPQVMYWNEADLPTLTNLKPSGTLLEMDDANAEDWLENPNGKQLRTQTLFQQNGFAMTLLHLVETEDDEEDDGLEDSFERFDRF